MNNLDEFQGSPDHSHSSVLAHQRVTTKMLDILHQHESGVANARVAEDDLRKAEQDLETAKRKVKIAKKNGIIAKKQMEDTTRALLQQKNELEREEGVGISIGPADSYASGRIPSKQGRETEIFVLDSISITTMDNLFGHGPENNDHDTKYALYIQSSPHPLVNQPSQPITPLLQAFSLNDDMPPSPWQAINWTPDATSSSSEDSSPPTPSLRSSQPKDILSFQRHYYLRQSGPAEREPGMGCVKVVDRYRRDIYKYYKVQDIQTHLPFPFDPQAKKAEWYNRRATVDGINIQAVENFLDMYFKPFNGFRSNKSSVHAMLKNWRDILELHRSFEARDMREDPNRRALIEKTCACLQTIYESIP